MNKTKILKVKLMGEIVGTMALYQNRFVAFEYDDRWLNEGFSISPFSLPLIKKVFIPEIDPFEGLFGVFADSIPDGWGRLLVDRYLNSRRIDSRIITAMDRLSIVGESGMGALTYEPTSTFVKEQVTSFDYDVIAKECKQLLENNETENLDRLLFLGGSSGGARPKILTKVDGEDWIIKFPSSLDQDDVGLMEYRYSECAKACGIRMAESRLFESKQCLGYFGTKRFDRALDGDVDKVKRIHMISVSALLEATHRIPNLDYHTLMKLTLELTKDYSEVDQLYRLMCFNVFAHNRDDHSKNFSYLYNRQTKSWQLSPAYDLTYSYSIGGEHATTINGNGQNPTLKDIMKVGTDIGIKERQASLVAKEIEVLVHDMLQK